MCVRIYTIQCNTKLDCGTHWRKSQGCSKYKWTNAKMKGSFRVTKHNGENTVFSPVTYQMLAAKCSMDVPGYKARGEICTYSVVPLLEVGKRTWALLFLGSDHFYWKQSCNSWVFGFLSASVQQSKATGRSYSRISEAEQVMSIGTRGW